MAARGARILSRQPGEESSQLTDLRSWTGPTAALAARSITAQAIVGLAGFGVARLYTPAQLGAATAFISGVGVVSVVAALRYDLALTVVAEEEEAERLLVLSIVAVAMTSVVVGALAIAAGPWLGRAAGVHAAVSDLRFAAPPAIVAIGLVGVALRWATRRRHYVLIGRTRIRQAVSQVVGQLGLGVAGFGVWGLALAGIAGSCAGGLRLAHEPWGLIRARNRRGEVRALWTTAKAYRRFPIFSLSATLCHAVATTGVPILVAALYGLRAAGYYILAQRVVTLPFRLINEAVASPFLGDSSFLRRTAPRALRPRLRQTSLVLGVIGLIPLAVLAVGAPGLFALAFGSRWRVAGEFAPWLGVLAAAQLTVSPVLQAFAVLSRLGIQAGLGVVQLVLTIVPLLVAHAAGASPVTAVTALSLGGATAYVLELIVVDRIAADP